MKALLITWALILLLVSASAIVRYATRRHIDDAQLRAHERLRRKQEEHYAAARRVERRRKW